MELLEQLQNYLRARERVIIAFSGGVDSAVLAKAAHLALGNQHMLAVTGDSASVPSRDREAARAFCATHGIPHRFLSTEEFSNPDYVANAGNRCFFCKEELFAKLEVVRARENFAWIVEGTNLSDLRGHRPGMKAKEQAARVLTPYVDLGIEKAGVRAIARTLQLDLAEKPATACLSSRVPVGTAVDAAVLAQIDAAENALRDLGFSQLRVRHHGTLARIEIPRESFASCVANAETIVAALQQAGYGFVTLDLQGYRTGGGINAA